MIDLFVIFANIRIKSKYKSNTHNFSLFQV